MNRKRHIFPAFYFYPRPPRGGRRSRWSRGRGCRNFYPRPPRGGRRPELQCCCTKRRIFLSTPSARRATLCLVVTFHFRDISIHALREEGDTLQSKSTERLFDFYPRPPRGGRRAQHGRLSTRRRTFLSTPSARRATSVLDTSVTATVFLSTPSARRATLRRALPDDLRRGISIHALREEGDRRQRRAGTGH